MVIARFKCAFLGLDKIIAGVLSVFQERMDLVAKPERCYEYKEVTYSAEHWILLQQIRKKAKRLLEALKAVNIEAVVHGSVARGDIRKGSDVDVFIPNPPSSFLIDSALEKANIPVNSRTVIQATPLYAMKAYVEIEEATTVSFPLMNLRRVEREFYKFSGEITIGQICADVRVSGVDKRLRLIEPTERGHVESSVLGRAEYVAKSLGISAETVKDRVRALTKRNTVGRTGVFIKQVLSADETFEMVLSRLAAENPAVRRKLRSLK
ncbi:MAG TPA: nucleotidyltransferase domain-containing protein [Candidatus Nanoarchaeia archaeon]|nr:nucleotidyltransferase domain-containing protein [Candidatus Nanoarchaeia archaeon]